MDKFSFVIPAYNEQDNIFHVYQRILMLMKKFEFDKWEIIFVNDGSFDETLINLKKICDSDNNVKIIDLSRNFGHQAALWSGLANSTGNAIISMDCDLQDPPEIIENMILKWKNGYEIVYAQRINFRNDNFFKSIATKLYYKLLDKFSTVDIPQNVGDFRLIDRKVLNILLEMKERSKYLRGMVAWTGFKSAKVEYHRPDRNQGVSNYSILKLFKLALNGLIGFSYIPLKLGLFMGLFTIITGFGLLTYQITDTFLNHAYYHLYKWIVVVLFIFMGFLFILIWILGEYIAKIYDEVRARPIFVIKEKINFE